MKYEKNYYTYIMASAKNGTLYIGVTSNLADRIDKHKQGMYDGFTKKYKVDKLVYYEIYGDVYEAITKEKQLKKWNREWKIKLIEKNNPGWKDLYDDLFKDDDQN
jgi:putative endonuclease